MHTFLLPQDCLLNIYNPTAAKYYVKENKIILPFKILNI